MIDKDAALCALDWCESPYPVIWAAKNFIMALPDETVATPRVVPMTRGRLQFEWHRRNRSLEIEVETPAQLHYLKWDSDEGVEEEGVCSITNEATIQSLIRWFDTHA